MDSCNDFKFLTSLGCGGFAEVKLACHLPTSTQVAVKVLKKNHNGMNDINSEVQILQFLEHRNIVRYYHVINTMTKTYLVMEYVAGDDLEIFLRDKTYLKEEEARPIFQQVVSAVHFLHQRLVAHRDIKLENILIDRAGNVKLCDFGMAIQLEEGQKLKNVCGSLFYMAPEILARKPYDGLAVDMWSLGVVLYVLVTGKFPYAATTMHGMHRLINSTEYPIPYHLSKPCCKIIAQLLTVPTRQRITIFQLLERRWLGQIEEHVEPASKEILPSVVETMCNIGYTCEEIVSCIRKWQANNNVTATFNILKHKLSIRDCHHQNGKPWLNISPIGTIHPLLPFKRAESESTLAKIIEVGKGDFQENGVERREKRCQSYKMPNKYACLEIMPCSDEIFSARSVLMANFIHNATGDIAMNMNSVDGLCDDISLCESVLNGTPIRILNKEFPVEQLSVGPIIPKEQSQVGPKTSGSRSLEAWQLIRKRITNALRILCCVPEPFHGESLTVM
ncbi:sperm motility kinase-like [Mesocricetus auratus]|uniref:non-specific serine/threonine protein kinase n=1 Tax=Mesocricetus auratus TaxID=10036 RepID=A0ABM2X2A6_MESAU|nr:sperm motility kinase-like [Mesocricetus auratus]